MGKIFLNYRKANYEMLFYMYADDLNANCLF